MPVRSAEIPVTSDDNLHLRPMQLLTKKAVSFQCKLRISRGDKLADAKSLWDVMMLAAEKGPLKLEADGDDADQAVDALVTLLNKELNKE